MLSVSPSCVALSSLEVMLESLWRTEAEGKQNLPPALPARPRPTSKARRPSVRRPLPQNFDISDASLESSAKHSTRFKKEEVRRSRAGSFGGKRIKELEDESPYVVVSKTKNNEQRLEAQEGADASTHSRSMPSSRKSEWDDKIGYFIKKKLRVWCRPQNRRWEPGHIQSTLGGKASILLLDGSTVTVSMEELFPANPDILEGVDDLIQLTYLNEPSVLYNLQCRYSRDIIYSKAGPILIAINPFKVVQHYGNDLITAYRQKLVDSPHVYAVADSAYTEMMRDEIDQSIIISGKSGAGKTETAKVAMQYLAALGGSDGEIECEILQTSCILEAFGNAKTSRNDNSSRFGNLIEIHFSATGKICGAKIQTFLLEKSRVVQRACGERSYHIFYQLCAGVPPYLKDRLNLKRAHEYRYLNLSGCVEIDGVDDAKKFHILTEALSAVRICKDDQECALEMLAAVLWLGNISFQVIDNESHVEVVADEAVTSTASLLGCSVQDLMLTLSTREIQAGKDKVAEKLTVQQAVDTRDALAKFIYVNLFDWLVEVLNKSLETGKWYARRSISILDIYGFESFQRNTFEQLCINYANERLQQHFIRHFLKLEQEEYELDGIDWRKVDFQDNQECLDFFEKKPKGLISLLEEELNCPEATDLTFASKLKQHLNANPCFKGERGGAFRVRHYGGEVLYDTSGFLEKNRDPICRDMIQFLSSCSGRLPRLFASRMLNQCLKRASSLSQLATMDPQKQGVATDFKVRLFKLMQQLENTIPHFICCVKPNSKQLPGKYEQDLVLDQVTCSGVLEVARISRSGYPTRMTHQEFRRRYGFMLLEKNACQDPLNIAVAVLKQFDVLPEMYQVGYTKLYFRVGQIGVLENMRKQVQQGKLDLQKCFHRHRASCCFHELKRAVIALQSFVRGENVRRGVNILKNLAKQVAHRTPEAQMRAVVHIQSVIRGWLARKHFSHLENLKRSDLDSSNSKQEGRKVAEAKDQPEQHAQILPPVVEELQRQVLMAEATLWQKEEENAALRRQVQQFEVQLSEWEAKQKSVEEMWQKQMASLQMTLAAANKSLATGSATSQPGRLYGSPLAHYCASEDMMSMGTQTGGSTPIKCSDDVLSVGAGQETNGSLNPVSYLAMEFGQQKQNFDDEAKALVEVKSGHSSSMNPVEELRRLKQRFKTWKKDYKVRLRQAKAKLQKNGYSEVEKGLRKWWRKKRNIL